MKVQSMTSNKGNAIANQFILTDKDITIFQSYNSIIAKKTPSKIILDKHYWNYSNTTSKYRALFLGETTKETEAKIKAGIYELADLN